ncbi:MAG: YerC/YecD family TrpR-related protein [Lawsonibacter sp.]|nr:YerC/YecD family TrpR-related protein [Lawsonibacter sp.]
MSHLHSNHSESIDQLFRAMLSLKNTDECYSFFSDLFTVQELTSFAQRLQVAQLLAQGHTYKMIWDQIPISSSTITRINTELRYGSGGYQMVLDRLAQMDSEHKANLGGSETP